MKQQFEQNAVVCCPLAWVCRMTTSVIPWKRFRI